MHLRAFVVAALAILGAGCAQQQPPATTAKQDCFSRFSGVTFNYTLLSSIAGVEFFRKTLEIETDAIRILYISDAQAKMKANELYSRLAKLDAEAETGRAQMGECFRVGYNGERAAENYARYKNSIASAREKVNSRLGEVLEKNQAVAERAALVERWRADNARHLKREAGNMKLEIVEVARRESYSSIFTLVTVAATNTTSSTILRPRNLGVWGYEFGSDVAGRVPIGTSLTDSFGNDYKLTKVSPEFLGNEGFGIRPGQTKVFELEFADIPLENAKSVRISVEPGAYGQSQGATFDIPADVFFGGM